VRGYTLTNFHERPAGTPSAGLPPHPPRLRLGPSLSPWERVWDGYFLSFSISAIAAAGFRTFAPAMK
jgi:hypothetical protein